MFLLAVEILLINHAICEKSNKAIGNSVGGGLFHLLLYCILLLLSDLYIS